MLKELKARPSSAVAAVAINKLIQNQNAIIAKLRGSLTQEEADAWAEALTEQE